jgi:ribosomal protein S18 acetylase RimI-like enzyme
VTTIIRPATTADHDVIWSIFHEVVAPGDTYAFDPGMSRDAALAYWLQPQAHAFVAAMKNEVVGTYHLKPNQAGPGGHVANAAFMVSAKARGRGIGRRMGEHCVAEARRLGFRALQFNFVVSTNEFAVRLWEQLGFRIVGTLPGAFHHPVHGYVDVYVMYLALVGD